MKKTLLTLAAVLLSICSFAYELGGYTYTTTAKFKIISENLVPTLNMWNGSDDVDTWSVYAGSGV